MGPDFCNRASTLMIASLFPSIFRPYPQNHSAEVVIWRWQNYAINIYGVAVATAERFSMQSVGLNNHNVFSKISQFHIRDAVRGSRKNGWVARGGTSPGDFDFVILHGFCWLKSSAGVIRCLWKPGERLYGECLKLLLGRN